MQSDNAAARRLKVVAEADPGALVRVLQFFQGRNIVPRRAASLRIAREIIEIEVEVDAADCTDEAFRAVVAKVDQLPIVIAAVVC
jgi:hypothetical protein